jgi:hypothetical protein
MENWAGEAWIGKACIGKACIGKACIGKAWAGGGDMISFYLRNRQLFQDAR